MSQYGHRLTGRILEVRGECAKGHRVGDTCELSGHETANLCGFFYHDIFPTILMLQFGGSFPWGEKDTVVVECPDRENVVKLELRRAAE